MGLHQLRVAFVGKGGAGKSLLAGTVCRHLARAGQHVLALDVDTVPGLAISLGAPLTEARLPTDLAEMVEGKGWRVIRGGGPARLVDRYAVAAPDGVRLLQLGKLPARIEPGTTVAFRYVMERFGRPGWALVADLAAGTRQPMYRWSRFANAVIAVADPSAKSRLSARRLRPVATHLVANKVSSEADLRLIRDTVDLPLLAVIPYDECLAEAERRGIAPIDLDGQSPAVRAAERLAGQLMEGGAGDSGSPRRSPQGGTPP